MRSKGGCDHRLGTTYTRFHLPYQCNPPINATASDFSTKIRVLSSNPKFYAPESLAVALKVGCINR